MKFLIVFPSDKFINVKLLSGRLVTASTGRHWWVNSEKFHHLRPAKCRCALNPKNPDTSLGLFFWATLSPQWEDSALYDLGAWHSCLAKKLWHPLGQTKVELCFKLNPAFPPGLVTAGFTVFSLHQPGAMLCALSHSQWSTKIFSIPVHHHLLYKSNPK